jgi:hypothetical protein
MSEVESKTGSKAQRQILSWGARTRERKWFPRNICNIFQEIRTALVLGVKTTTVINQKSPRADVWLIPGITRWKEAISELGRVQYNRLGVCARRAA